MMLLIRAAEVNGVRADVRVVHGKVVAIGRLTRLPGEEVLDAAGGALLPGLHDHHVHLLATAAALTSLDCGPAACPDYAALARAITQATRQIRTSTGVASSIGWVRGVGYHESVAGPLDRWRLDQICATQPVRIQHRSGALWMLNSAALALVLRQAGTGDGIETDANGKPNGRIWRRDDAIRAATASTTAATAAAPDLAALGRRMRRLGLTGATDATPDLGATGLDLLTSAVASQALPARLHLLGADTLNPEHVAAALTLGPRKLVVSDHNLPGLDELRDRIDAVHRRGRAVAMHCVSRVALVLTLAALESAGSLAGDRIEHGSVVPPEAALWIARLGLRVVTQPCLPAERGDDYLAEVEPADRPHLYPYASLLAAGIAVAPSSDAPYASLDPWAAMAAASARLSPSGRPVGQDAGVAPRVVLNGYLSRPDEPGGPPRRVTVGGPADLCLLHLPLAEALAAPHANVVRTVLGPSSAHE